MPRSKKTTLPASLPPSSVLGILTKPFLPVFVVQSARKASSDRLTINVDGTIPLKDCLLFDNLHSPSLPSLNDKETGTCASFTIVAHDTRIALKSIKDKFLNNFDIYFMLSFLNIVVNKLKLYVILTSSIAVM
jgi:hypothetical protein